MGVQYPVTNFPLNVLLAFEIKTVVHEGLSLPVKMRRMKHIIRAFFRILRIVLGPFMRLWEFATRPKGMVRPAALQQTVNQQCQDLVLYQFTTCPFCIKVRQHMRRLSLPIEQRDAQHNLTHREALQNGGGAYKVPCLKITASDGHTQWLYESGAIMQYLDGRFAKG
jgi:glutaredoxin